MKERPILFSGPMVRAILEDRKTQTRRAVKPPKTWLGMFTQDAWAKAEQLYWQGNRSLPCLAVRWATGTLQAIKCPYGQPGDRLWVRETWNSNGLNWGKRIKDMRKGMGHLHYAATDKGEWKSYWGRWKPSIHMPRWASRITLEIVSVRVERLQDISEKEAIAEGVRWDGYYWRGGTHAIKKTDQCWNFAKDAFKALWKTINGHDSWDNNPWVWVIEFKKVETDQCKA